MKRIIKLIILLLVLFTTTNAVSANNKDNCIRLLGAGIYNDYLEANCGFKGGVAGIVNGLFKVSHFRS